MTVFEEWEKQRNELLRRETEENNRHIAKLNDIDATYKEQRDGWTAIMAHYEPRADQDEGARENVADAQSKLKKIDSMELFARNTEDGRHSEELNKVWDEQKEHDKHRPLIGDALLALPGPKETLTILVTAYQLVCGALPENELRPEVDILDDSLQEAIKDQLAFAWEQKAQMMRDLVDYCVGGGKDERTPEQQLEKVVGSLQANLDVQLEGKPDEIRKSVQDIFDKDCEQLRNALERELHPQFERKLEPEDPTIGR